MDDFLRDLNGLLKSPESQSLEAENLFDVGQLKELNLKLNELGFNVYWERESYLPAGFNKAVNLRIQCVDRTKFKDQLDKLDLKKSQIKGLRISCISYVYTPYKKRLLEILSFCVHFPR